MTHLGVDLEITAEAWSPERLGAPVAWDLMGGDGAAVPVVERVGCLPAGMASGRPAFELAIRLPDGRILFAETSWQMIHAAVTALAARWPVEEG